MDNILGLRIYNKSLSEVLETVKKHVEAGKKLHIVTLNTELLVASKNDVKLQKLINNAGVVVAESSGLYLADNYFASKQEVKALRLLTSLWRAATGKRGSLPPRIAGVDLSYAIVALAEEFGYKLVLLGGKEDVAKAASVNLKKIYPKLKVSGIYGGLVGIEDEQMLRDVEKECPDILFVAFGQPTQEHWIGENLERLPVKVAMGVGGTLDFMSGRVPRAPQWVRSMGLEWAFRLVLQPWRIKRQVALIKFIKMLLNS